MRPTSSEPRAHHQAAQAYLQNFANKKRQVTVYDRKEKKTIPLIGIRNVAVAKDFYTTTDDDRRRDFRFETQFLARFDNLLPKLLAKLLATHPTLTTDERVKLDVIMTLQFLRTREGRRFLEDGSDFNLRLRLDAQFSGVPENKIDILVEELYAHLGDTDRALIKRLVQSPDQPLEFSTFEWLSAIVHNLMDVSNELTVRHWLILDSDKEAFLTSDTPVVLLGSEPLGLRTAAVIAWPISPNRIVLRPIQREGNRRKVVVEKATPEQVREINQELANRARQQIVWHPDTDPISSITLPVGEPQVRIGSRSAGPDERSFDVWRAERARAQEVMAPHLKRRALYEEAMKAQLERMRRLQR
jgi:hypothetical protein